MAKLQPDYIEWVLRLNSDQAREEYHKLSKENKELQQHVNAARKSMAELEAQGKKGSAEWVNLKQSIKGYTDEMKLNNAKMGELSKRIDLTSMSISELRKKLKDVKKEFESTSKSADPKRYAELKAEFERVRDALTKAEGSTRSLKDSFLSLEKMKTALTGFFTAIGMTILHFFVDKIRQAVTTIVDFEKANSKLAAVLGSTKGDIKDMTDEARRLGATTSYTASEVTSLQTELAKLGFDKEQIKGMETGVLKFAQAVDTDLASAAAFAGASMRIFGLQAEDVESMLASCAIGTTKSALSFSFLQNAMATVGPVANAFGFSIEDTIALLGNLANAGFDASSAATATRNILLNLADSNGQLAQALGAPVTSIEGLVDGLKKLNAEGVDLNQALELTDKRSVAAFTKFLAGAEDIATLRENVTDCTGSFNAMYDEMSDNVSTAFDILTSTIEGVVLKFYDWKDGMKVALEYVTSFVEWIGSLIDALTPLWSTIGAINNLLWSVIKWLGSAIGLVGKLLTQTAVGRVALNAIVGAMVAFKVASIAASLEIKKFIINIGLAIKSIYLKVKALYTETAAAIAAAAATRKWNMEMMKNPILLVISLIAMLVVAIISVNKEMEKAAEAENKLSEARQRHADLMAKSMSKYETEKDKLMELRRVAMDELETKEHRMKAIEKLNAMIPGYNATLDAETGKYRENKKALDLYLGSLEKKYRMEALKEEYQQILKDEDAARQQAYKDWKKKIEREKGRQFIVGADKTRNASANSEGGMRNVEEEAALKAAPNLKREKTYRFLSFSEYWDRSKYDGKIAKDEFMEYLRESGIDAEELMEETTDNIVATVDAGATTAVSRIKEIDAELKKLRKADPQSDDEFKQIQSRIKALQDEKKALLGKNRALHEPGTYGDDSIDKVTNPIDSTHRQKMLEINKNAGSNTEDEISIKKAEETKRYANELIAALQKLHAVTDATHTKTLDGIRKEMESAEASILEADKSIATASIKISQKKHDDITAANEAFYKTQQQAMEKAIQDEKTTKGAAEVYLLQASRANYYQQLVEAQRYYDEVQNAEYYGEEQRKNILTKLQGEISTIQSNILTSTGKWTEKMRSMTTDTTSRAGIINTYELQRKEVESTYNAMISAVGKNTSQAVLLEEMKQKKLEELNYKQLEQMYQLQEYVGLSWSDEYDRELAKLKHLHKQGLIDEKQYQKKRLEAGVSNAKKYFDYYAQLSGSMFSAIQDAEIATSDAKYDVLIQQAKNNGEDTAALEEEKENKKLEIQKKYADVNFAIKASQIIADTAVAIMKAHADLGPIAGAVAAVMLAATGVAQLASANAERTKIKNMQPSKTASSKASVEAPASATRSLTGYAEGGYTGDGGRYEVAGVVHRGEYVVPKPIMDNPRVVDAVGTIEAIRRNKMLGSGMPVAASSGSYADGGEVAPLVLDTAGFAEAVDTFKQAAKNMRAYLVYSDLERGKKLMDRARAPFTK